MPKKMSGLPKAYASPVPPYELCATQCYERDKPFVHPITGEADQFNQNMCATYPYISRNEVKWHQKCEISSQLIYPSNPDFGVSFDEFRLLDDIYDIRNLQRYVAWMKVNEYMPQRTRDRVTGCAWKAFVYEEQDLSDELMMYHRKDSERYIKSKDPDLVVTDAQMLQVALDALKIREQWRSLDIAIWMRKALLRAARAAKTDSTN